MIAYSSASVFSTVEPECTGTVKGFTPVRASVKRENFSIQSSMSFSHCAKLKELICQLNITYLKLYVTGNFQS